MKTMAKKWEWLCYTDELPWKADVNGKSIGKQSRVEMGVYELLIRTDGKLRINGGKGWRLELQKTRHRHHVQIHQAAPSMFIEAVFCRCISIHFKDLRYKKAMSRFESNPSCSWIKYKCG